MTGDGDLKDTLGDDIPSADTTADLGHTTADAHLGGDPLMSVSGAESNEDGASEPDGQPTARSFRPRFGMLSLMLFAGVVCVWSMYFQLLRVNPQIELQVEAMQALSTELKIDDATRIAVARPLRNWYDESIWMVYIPDGQTYEMHIATEDIDETRSALVTPPASEDWTTLSAGTFKIELRQEKAEDESHRVIVLVDDEVTLEVAREKEWDPGKGSSGGAHFSQPSQPTDDKQVVLFRRRFMQPKGDGSKSYDTPKGPTNGIELRLEKQEVAQED